MKQRDPPGDPPLTHFLADNTREREISRCADAVKCSRQDCPNRQRVFSSAAQATMNSIKIFFCLFCENISAKVRPLSTRRDAPFTT